MRQFATLLLAALLLPLLAPSPSAAATVSGVEMAPRVQVGGETLTLVGAGLRKKLMFKVYVAGLYLEKPTHEALQAVRSEQTKRVVMVMLRDLERGKITEAVEEGFEKNNQAAMPALRERLTRFNQGIRDLEEGDRLTITYRPGEGTVLESKGGERLVVEGKDFADALFSVWLGAHPVDADLKSAMLGAK